MPESRDRLSRPVDIHALYRRRRSNPFGIYEDQPELERTLFGSSPQTVARTGAVGVIVGGGRGNAVGTPVGQRMLGRNPPQRTPVTGRENTPIGSAQRRSRDVRVRSLLPSWYPRTPLQDITAVLGAVERRRERLGVDNGQEIGSPVMLVRRDSDSSESPSVVHLEHGLSPLVTTRLKQCPPSVGKVPKILIDITKKTSDDSEFLTPQKKLLNSIDTVEKVVMEELRKLKRTPSAKKAEREKRVKTLMSMR